MAPNVGHTRSKVCIVTPEFPPLQWGGLARTAKKVARHVAAMGFNVHVAHLVVAPTDMILLDENRKSVESGGLTIHEITVGRERMPETGRDLWDCPHTLTVRMMFQSLVALHESERFDAIHSFFLYPVGYVAGIVAQRMKVPSIAVLVGNDVNKYLFSPEKTAMCVSGLKNADRIVGLSSDLIEIADALEPIAQKSTVIFNSVEIPEKEWTSREREGRPFRVGAAGIFKYAKGLPYLFKAVARASESRPVQLALAGELRPAEKGVFETMAARAGIEHAIDFDGPLPPEDIPGWLVGLDTFALPSVSEGCPNILMEAMACGLPCVASRVGAVSDLMEPGVSGLVVPPGDSEALAAAFTEIIENPQAAATMGNRARAHMAEFSSEREFQAWNQLYAELLGFRHEPRY